MATLQFKTTTSFLSVAAGGAAFLAYSFASGEAAQAEAPPAPAPSTEVNPYRVPTTTHGLPKSIVLYQYEVCPFCCKVKAVLDYYKLPYRVVEVNPLTKAELKWSEYKKVPVVLLDGSEQVNNSSTIISRLAAEIRASESSKGGSSPGATSWFFGKKSASQGGAKAGGVPEQEVEDWRRWVDERLVKVITVNIYRSAREAFQTFDYITEHGNFGWVQREAARVVGATMMWSLSNRLKKKYKVEGDVREALYGCASEWVAAVGDRQFLGGDKPSLADLEAFGVMRSIVGTDTFMDLQHNTQVGPWYERMMAVVGETSKVAETV